MSVFAELKRRNVFRVAVFYIVTAWLVIQVAETLMPAFAVPESALRIVLFILVVGFIPAVVFAWLYELTPDGIRRERDVDRGRSVTHETARRMDLFTIAVVLLGVGFAVAERFWASPSPGSDPVAQSPVAEQPGQPGIKTIAVLPFVNMSAEAENEFFSDGISEEILNVLVKIRGLQVASRTSAFSFKGKDVDIPTVAGALGVDHIVEGSVRRAGDQVRITAQLINVESDSHLWSETYTRQLDDVFAIQDEIARAIADALSVELLGAQGQRVDTHDTENLEAFEAYLLGRHYFHQRTGESLSQAIDLFEQAIAADPSYARAYSGLADSYMLIFQYSEYPFGEAMEKAVSYAEKATELDPDLGEAWASRGLAVSIQRGDPAEYEGLFKKAIELNPGYSMAWMWLGNMYHSRTGQIDEAYEAFRKAEAIDPLHPVIAENIGDVLVSMGRVDDAVAHLKAALARDPENLVLKTRLGNAYWASGDLVQAHRVLRETVAMDPTSPLAIQDLIFLETQLGRYESAGHLIGDLEQRFPSLFYVAEINRIDRLGTGGQLEPALEITDRLFERSPAPFKFYSRQIRASLLVFVGDPMQAMALLETMSEDQIQDSEAAAHFVVTRALAAVLSGDDRADEWIEAAQKFIESRREAGDGRHELRWHEAAVLALLGRPEDGLALIRKVVDQGARFTTLLTPRAAVDRLFQSVPGYAEVARFIDSDVARQRALIETELDG